MSRVRNGTGKVEKLLSKGALPPSAAVIGEVELRKWQELLDHKTEKELSDERDLRTIKHDMSQDRKKGWGNTVEGAHAAKDKARKKRAEEDEERRRLIDVEEAELRVVERRAVVDDANRLLHQRDPRVVNLNSQLLLHEVLQEREEQVQLSARKRQIQKERDAEYADSINRSAEQERLEKYEKALNNRQNLVKLGQDRLDQLQQQKDQRNREVQSARVEGTQLRQLGDLAAREESQARQTARNKSKEVAVEHKKQLKEKSERSRKLQLDGLAHPDPALEERNMNHAVKKAVQNQIYQERLSARQEMKDQARLVALENYEIPNLAKDNGINQIMSARSLVDKALEADLLRSNFKEKSQAQAGMLDQQIQEDSARRHRMGHVFPSPPKGGKPVARGSLRIMDAEASMKDPRIQTKMAAQIAALDEEDRQSKIQAKTDALLLQRIHGVQANQKRMNDLNYNKDLIDEGRRMRSLEEEENMMFSDYVQSQMPAEMPSKLKKNAQTQPKPLRAS